MWFYLARKIRFFISKHLIFLFRKKKYSLKIAVPEFQKYKEITFNFSKTLKNKHEDELFQRYFSKVFAFTWFLFMQCNLLLETTFSTKFNETKLCLLCSMTYSSHKSQIHSDMSSNKFEAN